MEEFKAVNNEKLTVVRTWVRQEPFIKIVDGSVTVDGYRDGRYQQSRNRLYSAKVENRNDFWV